MLARTIHDPITHTYIYNITYATKYWKIKRCHLYFLKVNLFYLRFLFSNLILFCFVLSHYLNWIRFVSQNRCTRGRYFHLVITYKSIQKFNNFCLLCLLRIGLNRFFALFSPFSVISIQIIQRQANIRHFSLIPKHSNDQKTSPELMFRHKKKITT